MFSEDSELTDLSDEGAGHSTKSKVSKKKAGYRLRNVLKPGRTTQYTAKALYDQIHDDDIDLDPEYQRDVVWSEAKQIGLIDSIFRNFYIPPIIFSVTTEDDGTEKRVCIDGKQRLTSIQKFIGGLIPHRDPFTNERLWFVDSTSGPKRKLLPPQYKTLFQNKQIVCIEYSDLPPDLEREVFQRVQMGMALTTAEKMQAVSGPWPDLIREITNKYYLCADGISDNMDLNHARARDFQNLAQTIFCIDQLPNQAHGTTMQIEKWLNREEEPSTATRKQIHDVFKTFRDIARDKQLKLPLKKPSRVAPAEFIMIGVLIAMNKDRLSLPQLSKAIGILRSETRAAHADIRTNSTVFKTMFQVLAKQITPSNFTETPGNPEPGTASGDSAVQSNGKRKRHAISDEEKINDSKRGRDASVQKPQETPQANFRKSVTRPSLAPSGPPNAIDSPVLVKLEPSTPVVPPATMVSSNSNVSHGPTIHPSRFARIQAAKAQAAMMGNTTGSGSPSLLISNSLGSLPFQPPIPHPEIKQQAPIVLENIASTMTRQNDPPPNAAPPPNAPSGPRHQTMQRVPISIPVTPTYNVENLGTSHTDNFTLSGQYLSPVDSGNNRSDGHIYRERHGYGREQQNRGEYGDRGLNNDVDPSRDTSQFSHLNRDPSLRKPDTGWGQRGGHGVRGGPGYYR